MKYISQEITELTSSNATETTTPWSSSTTYIAGDFALFGTYIYKCVSAHTDKSPSEYTGIYWVKYSISNKLAMLDLSANSKTTYEGDLQVTFLQNNMDTLGIGNYAADTILVEIFSDDLITLIWTYETPSTINDNVYDYWDYMYSDYNYEVDRATYIPLLASGYKVRVTFKKSAESTFTDCGFLIGGIAVGMGKTLSNVNFSFNSYAVKNIDDFGSLAIIKRAVQDLVDFETVIPRNEFANNKRKLKRIYNDIVMFILDESETSELENLITLGVIQNVTPIVTEFDSTIVSYSIMEAL